MPSRARLLFVVAAALAFACATPRVLPDTRVALRPRTGTGDSALIVLYDARLCSLTFADPSGRLFDVREERGERSPVAMKRELPNEPWEVKNRGVPSHLFAVLTFPPGRYEVVELALAVDWEEIDPPRPPVLGRTNCNGNLRRIRTSMPFRIDAGKLTLLGIPKGPAGFDELRVIPTAAEDKHVRERFESWYASIDRARGQAFRELVARGREARRGYDVYRECDGHRAVVREQGAPAPWERTPGAGGDTGGMTQRFRPHFSLNSLSATGFGRGCVRPASFVLMLGSANELELATDLVGEWLVGADIAGEVDLLEIPNVAW